MYIIERNLYTSMLYFRNFKKNNNKINSNYQTAKSLIYILLSMVLILTINLIVTKNVPIHFFKYFKYCRTFGRQNIYFR